MITWITFLWLAMQWSSGNGLQHADRSNAGTANTASIEFSPGQTTNAGGGMNNPLTVPYF
jgi:hypothetical protein